METSGGPSRPGHFHAELLSPAPTGMGSEWQRKAGEIDFPSAQLSSTLRSQPRARRDSSKRSHEPLALFELWGDKLDHRRFAERIVEVLIHGNRHDESRL